MRHGFSLVELSIVLVILGLLTGGILTGQSLIRASELRAVSTEYQRYVTAIKTFRGKYFAIPGDMNNATSFWGNASTGTAGGECADNAADAGTGTQTCNGTGDSLAAVNYERLRVWQHLANAGLIEGRYTGLTGSGGTNHGIIGTNIPPSRMGNAGWSMATYSSGATITGNTSVFDGIYTNILLFGGASTTSENATAILRPEEAWNIDTKMDDSMPARGAIRVRTRLDCTNMTAAPADSAQLSASYNLTSSSLSCALVFNSQ